MVKFRNILAVTAIFLMSFNASAAWKVVLDAKCVAQVAANAASQKAIEDRHNERLDSIKTKQQKIEQYTATMATISELYKVTMENVKGFGTESKYYVEIGSCAWDIISDIPSLVKTVSKAKFHNKVLCLNELGNLTLQTQQLVADFVNIVNNAKIRNPLGDQATADTKGDGYNFLDRYERLTLANRIYSDLLEIRYKVEAMMIMAQYATMNDLWFTIDPEGWASVMSMANYCNTLAMEWNGLYQIAL